MRILCFGDSNTWGRHPATGLRQDKRWTKLLAQALKDDEIIEEGLNGRTTISQDPTSASLRGIDALPLLLASHQPLDLVILMLGTNDLKSVFHSSAKLVARGAKACIETIQNPCLYKYPVPQVLLVAPIQIHDQIVDIEGPAGEFDAYSLEQSRYLGQEMAKVAQEKGVSFLKASQFAKPSALDGLHMDEANHQALAQALLTEIERLKTGDKSSS